MATKKLYIGHVKGDTGDMGKITNVTATVDANVGVPGVTAAISGEPGEQTITFTFTNLKGAPGNFELSGDSTKLILCDGTEKTIVAILQDAIETIRTSLGVATKTANGLMPKLPETPEAE